MNPHIHLDNADAETLRLLVNWISKRINKELVNGAVCEFFDSKNQLSLDLDLIIWRIMEGCESVSKDLECQMVSISDHEERDPEDYALDKYLDICRVNCQSILQSATELGRWDVVASIAKAVLSIPLEMECELARWMAPSFHHFTSHVHDCISLGQPVRMFELD